MSYPYGQAGGRARPTVVTVIGILAIVFGAMGLLSLPMNLLQMAGMWPGSEFTRPMFDDPMLGTWMKVSFVLTPVLCVLWIVSGIGLLRLREWARKLALGLLVLGLAGQVGGALFVMPAMSRSVGGGMFPPGSQEAAMMQTMMSAIVVVSIVVGAAVAVTLIVLLTRPHVRIAFQPEGP